MPPKPPEQFNTLLRVRKRQEEECARVLAAAQRDVAAAQKRRAELAREQMRTLDQAGQAAMKRFDAADVRRYHQYERHLARMADQTDAEIRELRGIADQKRRLLEAAMVKRKMIERLCERRAEAMRIYRRRQEQRRTDEAAANSAALAERLHERRSPQGIES